VDAGLCAACIHARIVRSDRDSVFYRCQRALSDPNFPKYPRLPVLTCRGFDRLKQDDSGMGKDAEDAPR
jgi:hypothetical protein